MIELFLENGERASMDDVVAWWLEHYEGLEAMTEGGNTSPETSFTINTILKRSFEKIKQRKKVQK